MKGVCLCGHTKNYHEKGKGQCHKKKSNFFGTETVCDCINYMEKQ